MEKRVRRRTRRSRKKTNIIIISAAAVFTVLLVFFVCGISASNAQTAFPNLFYEGVDVGGLTYSEAVSAIKSAGVVFSNGRSVSVKLTDDVTLDVSSEDAGYAGSVEDAAKRAVDYGKTDGFIGNTVKYIGSIFAKHDLAQINTFDAENVGAMIADAAKGVNHGATTGSYSIENDTLSVIKAAGAYQVDEKAVYDFVYNAFTTPGEDSISTDKFCEAKNVAAGESEIDFDSLRSEIYVEPKSASFDVSTGKTVSGIVGIDLDVTAAKALYSGAAPGEKIDIPLIVTQPEVNLSDIEGLLFRDCLASKTTSLSTSSSNRINNVTLAAASMNDTVLMPGETFSYNNCLGKRTTAKGYLSAGAYSSGLEVQQIGGGICQGSSTLYYCVLLANLKVVERSNHMFSVAYLPLGMDATVDWGNVDFKFKNDKEYPIKLVAFVEEKKLTVEIWGTKTDENTIELKSVCTGVFDYETVEELDETKKPGESEVSVTGHKGYSSEAYRYIYDKDGNLVSKTLISKDKYRTRNKVILVGELSNPEGTPTGGGTTTGGETTQPVTPPTPPQEENPPTPPENPGSETTSTEPEVPDLEA